MPINMQYEYALPTIEALLFKTGAYTYEVIYPELLHNGTTPYICRNLKKRVVDFSTSPPSWGSESSIDVETPSGFTNPITPDNGILGYNFETDEILLGLGEWDGTSAHLSTTSAKLLAIKRDFSAVNVIQSDLFALAQTAVTDAARIAYYIQFYGYGGKIAGILELFSDSGSANERSCIITYDGATWTAIHANTRYDYAQQGIEPIWGASDNFLGWLTRGHGTNSHFISYPALSVTAGSPGGLFTTEPIYDPINHQVIWIEWGAETGATQHVWTADPTDPFTATDVTPTGTKTDNEGHTIDLNVDCKASGSIFSDGTNNWLVLRVFDNPDRLFFRAMKVTLGSYNNANAWDIIADPSGNDDFLIYGSVRAINPTDKLFLPSPLFIVSSGIF